MKTPRTKAKGQTKQKERRKGQFLVAEYFRMGAHSPTMSLCFQMYLTNTMIIFLTLQVTILAVKKWLEAVYACLSYVWIS